MNEHRGYIIYPHDEPTWRCGMRGKKGDLPKFHRTLVLSAKVFYRFVSISASLQAVVFGSLAPWRPRAGARSANPRRDTWDIDDRSSRPICTTSVSTFLCFRVAGQLSCKHVITGPVKKQLAGATEVSCTRSARLILARTITAIAWMHGDETAAPFLLGRE